MGGESRRRKEKGGEGGVCQLGLFLYGGVGGLLFFLSLPIPLTNVLFFFMRLTINSFTLLGHKCFRWITIFMKSINSLNKCFPFVTYNQLSYAPWAYPYLVFLIVQPFLLGGGMGRIVGHCQSLFFS